MTIPMKNVKETPQESNTRAVISVVSTITIEFRSGGKL